MIKHKTIKVLRSATLDIEVLLQRSLNAQHGDLKDSELVEFLKDIDGVLMEVMRRGLDLSPMEKRTGMPLNSRN